MKVEDRIYRYFRQENKQIYQQNRRLKTEDTRHNTSRKYLVQFTAVYPLFLATLPIISRVKSAAMFSCFLQTNNGRKKPGIRQSATKMFLMLFSLVTLIVLQYGIIDINFKRTRESNDMNNSITPGIHQHPKTILPHINWLLEQCLFSNYCCRWLTSPLARPPVSHICIQIPLAHVLSMPLSPASTIYTSRLP